MIISKNRKLKIPWGEGRFLLAAQGQQSAIHLFCLPSFSHFCLSLEFREWWHCFASLHTNEKALGLFWLVKHTFIFCVSLKRWGCTLQGLQAWHLPIAEILLQQLYHPHEIINSWKQEILSLLYLQWLEPCPWLIITPQIFVEWMIMQ